MPKTSANSFVSRSSKFREIPGVRSCVRGRRCFGVSGEVQRETVAQPEDNFPFGPSLGVPCVRNDDRSDVPIRILYPLRANTSRQIALCRRPGFEMKRTLMFGYPKTNSYFNFIENLSVVCKPFLPRSDVLKLSPAAYLSAPTTAFIMYIINRPSHVCDGMHSISSFVFLSNLWYRCLAASIKFGSV